MSNYERRLKLATGLVIAAYPDAVNTPAGTRRDAATWHISRAMRARCLTPPMVRD
jgi:hypothetical protein